MPMGTCRILFNDFEAIAAALDAGIGGPVEAIAQEIVAGAQGEVARDTGAAEASIYYIANGHNGYQTALGEARSRRPEAEEVSEATPPTGKGGGVVSAAVAHALFIELGTRRMAARPFFLHWADDLRERLLENVARFIDGLH